MTSNQQDFEGQKLAEFLATGLLAVIGVLLLPPRSFIVKLTFI